MTLNQEAYEEEFSPTMQRYREGWIEADGRFHAETHKEFWCGGCGAFIGIPGVPCDCETARTADPNIGRYH